MATQLFGDGLHLTRGHPLYVHLQHRRYQRFLASLVAFEHFRAEAALPVLRHPQLDLRVRELRANGHYQVFSEPAHAAARQSFAVFEQK